LRKPRLNRAVATVAVLTVRSLSRVAGFKVDMVAGDVAVATLLELIIHYDRMDKGASHVTILTMIAR